MTSNYGYLSKQFLTWLLANILGFGSLGALYFLAPPRILMSGIVVTTLLISIPIGLAQWIALRRIMQTSPLWIFSILIGLLLAHLFQRIIPDGFWQLLGDDESITTLTILYAIGGFVIGLPQWVILRRHLSPSSIWLLGSSIGAGAGLWIILVTDLINLSGVFSYIVAVLAYSLITGLTLAGLLAYNDHIQANLVHAT